MQSSPFSKKKAFGLGLAGLAAAAGIKAAQPEPGVFQNLPQGPAQTALEQNQRTAQRIETTPGKYVSEVFLDRLVNNGLAKPGNEATLKRVAMQQAQVVRGYLQDKGEEFTIENFERLRGSEELGQTLANIEREELGAKALPDHTEIFFGPDSRAEKIRRQNERVVQSFNESGWKQAVAVRSQHNFKAAEINAEFASSAPETNHSARKAETDPNPSPLIPVTLLTVAAGALSLGAFAVRRYGHELGQRVRQTTAGWSKSDFFALKFPTFQAWGQKARQALHNPLARRTTVASTASQFTPPSTTDLDDWHVTQSDPAWNNAPTNTDPVVPDDVLTNTPAPTPKLTREEIRARYATITSIPVPQFEAPSSGDTLDFQAATNLQAAVQKAEATLGPEGRTKAELLRLQALVPRLEATTALDASEADYVMLELDDLLHRHALGEDVTADTGKLSAYLRTLQSTAAETARWNKAREQEALDSLGTKLTQLEAKIKSLETQAEEQKAQQARHATREHLLEYRLLQTVLTEYITTVQTDLDQATKTHQNQTLRANATTADYFASVAEQLLTLKDKNLAKVRAMRLARQIEADINKAQKTRDAEGAAARAEQIRERKATYKILHDTKNIFEPAEYADLQEQLAQAYKSDDSAEVEDVIGAVKYRSQEILAETQAAEAKRAQEYADAVQATRNLLHSTESIFDQAEYEDLAEQLALAEQSGNLAEVEDVAGAIEYRSNEIRAQRHAQEAEQAQDREDLVSAIEDFQADLANPTLSTEAYEDYQSDLQTLTDNTQDQDSRETRAQIITLHRTLQEELYNPTPMTPNLNQPKPGLTSEQKAERRERIDLAQAEYKVLREARTHLSPSAYAEYRRQLKEAFANKDEAKVKSISELITHDTATAQAQAEERREFVEGVNFLAGDITDARQTIGEDEVTRLLEALRHVKANQDSEAFYRLQQEFDDLRNKQQSRTEYFTQPEKFGPPASARPTIEPTIPFGEAARPELTPQPKLSEAEARKFYTPQPKTGLNLPSQDFQADLQALRDEYTADPAKFVAEAISFDTGEEFGPFPQSQWPRADELPAQNEVIPTVNAGTVEVQNSLEKEAAYERTRDLVIQRLTKLDLNGIPGQGVRPDAPLSEKIEFLTNAKEIYFGDLGGDGINNLLDYGLISRNIRMRPEDYSVVIDREWQLLFGWINKIILEEKDSSRKKYKSTNKTDKTLGLKYKSLTRPLYKPEYTQSARESVQSILNDNPKCVERIKILLQKYSIPTVESATSLEQLIALHDRIIEHAEQAQWVPSNRKLLLCGDAINDRGPSDAVTLSFIKNINKQARETKTASPFTITLSNHDLGTAIYFSNKAPNITSYKSDKAVIYSNKITKDDYYEYLLSLDLLHYDPTKKLLLSHCLLYPEAYDLNANTFEDLEWGYKDYTGDIIQELAIDELPHKEIQSVKDMEEVIERMNRYYKDTIRILKDNPRDSSLEKRLDTLMSLVESRSSYTPVLETYKLYKFKNVVVQTAHGHDIGYSIVEHEEHLANDTTSNYSASQFYDPSHYLTIHDLQVSNLVI